MGDWRHKCLGVLMRTESRNAVTGDRGRETGIIDILVNNDLHARTPASSSASAAA